MSPAKKVVISLGVSAVLAAGAIFFIGARATLDAVWETGWGAFFSAGAALYLMMAFQAAAWARLERELGDKPRFRTLLASTVVAMGGNVLMPSAHLGGEPAKILYAGRNTGIRFTRLTGTVLLCKYIEAISFVVFFAGSAVATLVGLRGVLLSGPARGVGYGIIGLTAVALGLSVILWQGLGRRWTPVTAAVAVLGRVVMRRFFKSLRRRVLHMELWASKVYRRERHAVPAAFGWYLMTHVMLFVRPLAFFYLGWGVGLNAAELSLLFLAGQLALAVQFMPSGIGTLDGGMVSVVALAGMAISVPQCAAFLLCLRFWDATAVVLGMALAGRTGMGLFRGGTPRERRRGALVGGGDAER